MLEAGDALATWRVADDPLGMSPGQRFEAAKIHDHRKAYLDYSGEISGGRGRVDMQDSGELSLASCDDDLWAVELGGTVLRGRFELRRVVGDNWTLEKMEKVADQ